MENKVLWCKDCGASFVFTVKGQIYFARRGWKQPIRCPECRAKAKENRALYSGLYDCMQSWSIRKYSRRGTGYFRKLA